VNQSNRSIKTRNTIVQPDGQSRRVPERVPGAVDSARLIAAGSLEPVCSQRKQRPQAKSHMYRPLFNQARTRLHHFHSSWTFDSDSDPPTAELLSASFRRVGSTLFDSDPRASRLSRAKNQQRSAQKMSCLLDRCV